VLTFEQLDSGLGQPDECQPEWTAALDGGCIYLEQFYAQDVRTGSRWTDTFGGPSRYQNLAEKLEQQGIDRRLILTQDRDQDDVAESFSSTLVVADATAAISELESVLADDASTQQLVWVHIGRSEADESPESFVQTLLGGIRQLKETPRKQTGFVVTGCRGSASSSAQGPAAGVDEAVIRLPAWIGLPGSQFVREQTLIGSHAIPELILRLMTDAEGSDSPALPAPAFTILADEYDAVRSIDAMVVRPETVAADTVQDDPPSLQLYLKPEDVWNVHDQAEVYADLRDELAALLPE